MSTCFESASLDTNILIHLWKSETEAMLGQMFEKVYVYQWLLDVELRHHADRYSRRLRLAVVQHDRLHVAEGVRRRRHCRSISWLVRAAFKRKRGYSDQQYLKRARPCAQSVPFSPRCRAHRRLD